MNSKSVAVRIPRGLMYSVLRSISFLGLESYGARIRTFVSEQVDKDLPSAQIYTLLMRLERQGLVTSLESEWTEGQRGQARRIYSLTKQGHESLKAGAKLYGGSASAISGDSTREEGKKTRTSAVG